MDYYSNFTSSNIRAWLYNPESGTLDVRFLSNAHYRYFGVPAEVVTGWAAAESKGKYHHANIKGKYRYRRLG